MDSYADKYVATLGTEGWLDNDKAKLEKVFFYYVCSSEKQSNFFNDSVYSLLSTLTKSSSVSEIEDGIRSDLTALLSEFFDINTATIEIDNAKDDREGVVNFFINIKVQDSLGREITLERVLMTRESKLINFQSLLARVRGNPYSR